MAREIKKFQAWVIFWLCTDANRAVLRAETQGKAISVFPSRTSKRVIEGAMIALHQVLAGSDAGTLASRLMQKPPPGKVEWDYPGLNARFGVGLEVWAQRAEVSYDRSEAALHDSRGSGLITFEPTAKWQTRQEYREHMNAEMDA